MHDFFHWLFGERGQVVVAGALGGVVRWMTLRESWVDGLISVVVGAICATYLGPLVRPILAPVLGGLLIPEASQASFSGFMIGIGGITISGFVIDIWKARRRALGQTGAKTDGKEGDR